MLAEMAGPRQLLVLLLLHTLIHTTIACFPFFWPFTPKTPTSQPSSDSTSSSSSSIETRAKLVNTTNCGQQGGGRIVGGKQAGPHEFPWHCALLNKQKKFYGCSATLLSCDPVIIVTAAHCAPQIDIPLLPIVITLSQPSVVACGKINIRDDKEEETKEEEEQRLKVKKVIVHPNFNDRKGDCHSKGKPRV